MSRSTYLQLIEQLASLEPPVFVFGGVAEDAVLDGSITRPHGDVDVLVARATLDRHLEQLGALGFTDFDILFESYPGVPLVLGAVNGGLNVELGVFDEMDAGRASFDLPTDTGAIRITLPADTFTFPLASIDGVAIRTISPLAMFQIRQAFMLTGVFGPARDKDVAAQARLRAELLGDASEADLSPRIEPAPTRPGPSI
jgi:hypothetical protein